MSRNISHCQRRSQSGKRFSVKLEPSRCKMDLDGTLHPEHSSGPTAHKQSSQTGPAGREPSSSSRRSSRVEPCPPPSAPAPSSTAIIMWAALGHTRSILERDKSACSDTMANCCMCLSAAGVNQQHLSVKSDWNGEHKVTSLTPGKPYRGYACLIPKSPVCSTSVRAPYRPRAQYTSLAPARMEEVYLGKAQLLMHEPKHGNATLDVTYS